MPQVNINQIPRDYSVVSSDRKSVGLIVKPDGTFVVRKPDQLSSSDVKTAIEKKRSWLGEKLSEIDKIKEKKREKEFVSGEGFSYLGRSYRLKVLKDSVLFVKANGRRLEVHAPESIQEDENKIREAIVSWYFNRAEEKLTERARRYEGKVDVSFKGVKIKDQEKRWGSRTKNRTLLFNWRIMMAPLSIVDYVVVHELCHLKFNNHSKKFWKLLCSVLPDYQERKKWLEKNGPLLEF